MTVLCHKLSIQCLSDQNPFINKWAPA